MHGHLLFSELINNKPVSLGPLMSLVTGMARLLGRILLSVHMENFSPVTEMKSSDAILQPKSPARTVAEFFRFY